MLSVAKQPGTNAVTVLIALFLGGRAALVVFIAVPATLALTLFSYYCLGYTLNRITFFGLILSIGILVDDPIIDVENITRHHQLPENTGRSALDITVDAVNEVRSPLILATLAVVFAILLLAFVGGMVRAMRDKLLSPKRSVTSLTRRLAWSMWIGAWKPPSRCCIMQSILRKQCCMAFPSNA
jgi:multidrug efflux pump subunit AcrB